jgi:hypothetical protein
MVVGLTAPTGTAQDAKEQADEAREQAFAITRAAAAEYEIRVGDQSAAALELKAEPVLRWSNPEVGDIEGNVFLWLRGERPLAIGSFYHTFSSAVALASGSKPSTMQHEFHSLAEEPLSAKFHGESVWTTEKGIAFTDIPDAPPPAESETLRNSQLRQLAKQFTGQFEFRTTGRVELRLLPQPIYRYSAPKAGIEAGGVFAFVRTTDPEILLLIEARRSLPAEARCQFAAARLHSMAELSLEHGDKQIWKADPLAIRDIFEVHKNPYTSFKFKEIPDFLQKLPDVPKP